MTTTFLLFGAGGQIGHELSRALPILGRVVAPGRAECDLTDGYAVRRMIRRTAPDVIVNAAGYTAVDSAEQDPRTADRLNAALPALLAQEAAQASAWLVHYSSDYVFDGVKKTAYAEADAPAPVNTYGRGKLVGDVAVAKYPKHLIFRTSWVFGLYGNNFLKAVLRQAHHQDELAVVDDQWGAPTSAALIADVTAHALRAAMLDQNKAGLYHLASAGYVNWHGYATYILTEARRLRIPLRCGPDDIRAISTASRQSPAPRPANSRLDTSLLTSTFNLHLPSWREQVTHLLRTLSQFPSSRAS